MLSFFVIPYVGVSINVFFVNTTAFSGGGGVAWLK